MLLSDQERKRFAEYLVQDATSNRLLAKQISLPTLAAAKRRLADAQEIVARELVAGESMEIGK